MRWRTPGTFETVPKEGVRALALALLLLGAAAAFAQDTKPAGDAAKKDEPPAAKPAEATPEVTETITVTARKQGAEQVKDVPFSIAAPSEETLRARGADNIEGVAANVPGF